jgi:NifU-like protein
MPEKSSMPEYSAKALAHFHAPRNAGPIADADVIGHGSLDGCGRAPRTEIYLKLAGDVVERAGFTTFGCGAAIASSSALTEMVVGRPISQCREIGIEALLENLDGLPPDKEFCAHIAIDALQNAILQWNSRKTS